MLGIQVLTSYAESLEWIKSNRNPNVESYVANMFEGFPDSGDLPSVSTG